MNSKTRVLNTINYEKCDRIPLDYIANPGIDQNLKKHFHLNANQDEKLLKYLNIDIRNIQPKYTGPVIHTDIPEKGIKADIWGIRRRYIDHGSGGYWDYCNFPLKNAAIEDIEKWPMPSPDDFDYTQLAAEAKTKKEFAISIGHPGVGDVINTNGMLRGMDQALIDLLIEDPAGLLLAKRRAEVYLEIMRRCLENAKGFIDLLWIGEDLGTQHAPMISLESYRKLIRPIHQQFVDLAKAYKIPVMIHTCGSSSWVYPDFIEMGVRAVQTLQPEAKNMEPAYLKKEFGGKLAFHGCITTAFPTSLGNQSETETYCKEVIDIMKPGGGFIFAPAHELQDNSPVENVLAMYQTALEHGTY